MEGKSEENVIPKSFFDVFVKKSPSGLLLSMVLGAISGGAFALVIPLILHPFNDVENEFLKLDMESIYFFSYKISYPKYAVAFLLLCLTILVTQIISKVILTRVATSATVELRKKIYAKISDASIYNLEQLGASRILAMLTTDVPRVIDGASTFPNIIVSAFTIFGMLLFLLFINTDIFYIVFCFIFFGVITYNIPFFWGMLYFKRARINFDHIYEGIRGLLYGAKELKSNSARKIDFLNNDLLVHEQAYEANTKGGNTLITIAISYGNMICFFAIGIIAFVVSERFGLTKGEIIASVMTILYITGPLASLMNSFAPIIQASISIKNITMLVDSMDVEEHSAEMSPIEVSEITLENIFFAYKSKDSMSPAATLGPINLKIKQGEVVFILGGNGSGKSTLGKIISQHYKQTSGNIYANGVEINEKNRQIFRENFSIIYTDFYLFTKLHGIKVSGNEEMISSYLQSFGLDKRVAFKNGEFSTLELSDGQKKRLALLVAYMENRKVCLFDEWAADQDPEFKKIFYTKIIPELKSLGKTVIVITHDDSYFHYADRSIRIDNGLIVNELINSKIDLNDHSKINNKFSQELIKT